MTIYTFDFQNVEGMNDDDISDFSIHCQEENSDDVYIFKFDKVLFKGASAYLDMLMDGGFKESEEQFAHIQDDPTLVVAMLCEIFEGFQYEPGHIPQQIVDAMPAIQKLRPDNLLDQVKFFAQAEKWVLQRSQCLLVKDIRDAFWSEPRDMVQIEAALNYAFDHTCADHVNELLAHLCHKALNKDVLQNLCNEVPQLGWYLYQDALKQAKGRPWTCHVCKELQVDKNSDSINAFVEYDEGDVKMIQCCCGFRGLCSEFCKPDKGVAVYSTDGRALEHFLCCWECAGTGGLKTKSRLYYGEDGLIYCHAYFKVYSHTCTTPGAHWLGSGKICELCNCKSEEEWRRGPFCRNTVCDSAGYDDDASADENDFVNDDQAMDTDQSADDDEAIDEDEDTDEHNNNSDA